MTAAVSVYEALLGGVVIGGVFVGSLYAFGNRLLVQHNWNRDHPNVVVDRIRTICATCLVIAVGLTIWLQYRGLLSAEAVRLGWPATTLLQQVQVAIRLLGLEILSVLPLLRAALLPLVHTMLLFLGPLQVWWQERPATSLSDWTKYGWPFSGRDPYRLIRVRNYVVGPCTEELVFRACLAAVLRQARLSIAWMVALSSLIFGLAHIHHAWEMYARTRWQRNALRLALIRSAFQLGYCAVFGTYVMLVFLRTGHLSGPILAHAFCNIMGLPDLEALRASDGSVHKVRLSVHLLGIVLFAGTASTLLDTRLYNSIYW